MKEWKYSKTPEILFWESILTAESKNKKDNQKNCSNKNEHVQDACLAVGAFRAKIPEIKKTTATEKQINEKEIFSLIGACLLRAGWTTDINWLSRSVPVVKA